MSTAMADPLDNKALRKAWLKQKFASFEYHEEMLMLHRQWLDVLRRALARAEGDDSALSHFAFKSVHKWAVHFRQRYLPLIEANDDMGKYVENEWPRYRATATFRSIPDYSRYLISEGDALGWMTEQETAELGKYWGPMARMAQNIHYTVDSRWDDDAADCDWILDEKYTGTIVWPASWREELLGPTGSSLAAFQGLRVRAGDPVSLPGLWQSVDTAAQQQRVNAGDTLPDLSSAYGTTIWQRVGD